MFEVYVSLNKISISFYGTSLDEQGIAALVRTYVMQAFFRLNIKFCSSFAGA